MTKQQPAGCEGARGRFHAYRGGGLSELERVGVAKHLGVCAACRAELWLQAQLEDSAKLRPAPLSDVQKSAILARVHAEAGGRGDVVASRAFAWRVKLARWLAPPSLALPRFALAGGLAVALAFVAVAAWQREGTPAPSELVTGVAAKAGGVHAIALAPSAMTLERGGTGDTVSLAAGRVAIEFERRAASGPLRIELPQGVAIVRGTVLVVSVEAGRSRVAVRHGLVEVQPIGSEALFVRAGEVVSLGAGSVVKGMLGATEAAELEALWPNHEASVSASSSSSSSSSSSPPSAERAGPPMERPQVASLQSPARAPAESPALEPVALEVALSEARALEAQGARREAIARLARGLVAASGAEPGLVEEARYRLASLYRAVGELARAAEVLAVIVGASGAETAQVASLERGRVLLELGSVREGIAALLVAARGTGPVAEDALALACTAMARGPVNAPASDEVALCVSDHRARFPDSPHRSSLEELLAKPVTSTREP